MISSLSIRGDHISQTQHFQKESAVGKGGKTSFGDILKDTVGEINKLQMDADRAIAKVELGNSASIHEAMIALEKASISFRAMMEVRNRIIEAYHEVMRMQV